MAYKGDSCQALSSVWHQTKSNQHQQGSKKKNCSNPGVWGQDLEVVRLGVTDRHRWSSPSLRRRVYLHSSRVRQHEDLVTCQREPNYRGPNWTAAMSSSMCCSLLLPWTSILRHPRKVIHRRKVQRFSRGCSWDREQQDLHLPWQLQGASCNLTQGRLERAQSCPHLERALQVRFQQRHREVLGPRQASIQTDSFEENADSSGAQRLAIARRRQRSHENYANEFYP